LLVVAVAELLVVAVAQVDCVAQLLQLVAVAV
jgi:hypothetical protein